MDKSIISMRSAAVPQRNQRKKSLEGSGKCKVNARDMLHWPNCGRIAFFSNSTTTENTTNSANDVICGSAEVSPHCCRTQLYHSGKQKEKIHPLFKDMYQRYVKSLNPSSWAGCFLPPYHCLQAGGVRSLIGLHFKHISHVNQWASSWTISEPQNTLNSASTQHAITLFSCLHFHSTFLQLTCSKSLPCSPIHNPLKWSLNWNFRW